MAFKILTGVTYFDGYRQAFLLGPDDVMAEILAHEVGALRQKDPNKRQSFG